VGSTKVARYAGKIHRTIAGGRRRRHTFADAPGATLGTFPPDASPFRALEGDARRSTAADQAATRERRDVRRRVTAAAPPATATRPGRAAMANVHDATLSSSALLMTCR
jgi:hypothetical protein